VDQSDAEFACGFRTVQPHFAARHEDPAFVLRIGAGEDFHQCTFSRAVLADQRESLAGVDLQVHVPQH